jgi:hypothetical protein
MVNPISYSTIAHPIDAVSHPVPKPAAPNPPATSQPPRVQDSLSLKSTGDSDHDSK